MKLTIEECNDEGSRNEIENLLAQGNLSYVIKNWVNDHRKIIIISGQDDDSGFQRAYLLFEDSSPNLTKNNTAPIASTYIDRAVLLSEIPLVAELIPPPLLSGSVGLEDSEADELFYERRAELLDYSWNEDLCQEVCSLDAAIKGALGLALSEYGETVFSKAESEFLEDTDYPEIYSKHFLFVDSKRSDSKRIMNECSSCYVDLRESNR